MGAQVHVSRPTQRADRERDYDLLVDGEHHANVGANSTTTLQLQPGTHEIVAQIDHTSSNTLQLQITEGSETLLEVGSNLQGWRSLLGLLYITVLRSRYLYLRQL